MVVQMLGSSYTLLHNPPHLGADFMLLLRYKLKGNFMAVVLYGTPVNFMNIKQLRRIARDSFISFDLSTTKAALVSAINA